MVRYLISCVCVHSLYPRKYPNVFVKTVAGRVTGVASEVAIHMVTKFVNRSYPLAIHNHCLCAAAAGANRVHEAHLGHWHLCSMAPKGTNKLDEWMNGVFLKKGEPAEDLRKMWE